MVGPLIDRETLLCKPGEQSLKAAFIRHSSCLRYTLQP